MKTLRPLLLTALMLLFILPGYSQGRKVKVFSSSGDSSDCGAYLSAYRSFFRLELYGDAHGTWLQAFTNCPASSERMYLDGVTMYRSFIEDAGENPNREGLIDTLMLIYDRRIENFGNEGNVLGRKGKDLLTYGGGEIEQVQQAYTMLKKSIELQGNKSLETVMFFFISSGVSLNKAGKINVNQVLGDYLTVIGIMDRQEKRGSRWERSRASIDELMIKEDLLSCKALNTYYESLFESKKNDQAFLEDLLTIHKLSGCDQSDFFVAASEILYRIEPGPETAYNLAILFITRNNFEKAVIYLKEAAEGENIDMDTRAERYYELAVVSIANKDYCSAIEYARKAIRIKSNYGKAYMVLGDAIIGSRDSLGDDFQQRTAFWVAADNYEKARSADPSLAKEAGEKVMNYDDQFPDSEEIFFRDLKVGDSYLVGGCINEYTTVRPRK